MRSSELVPSRAHTIFFRRPASLRSQHGGPSGLFLDVDYVFELIESAPARSTRPEPARIAMYQYRLLDHDHRELLVYHWQPGPEFAGPDHPHLHVSASLIARTDAVTERRIDLDNLHLATGLVPLPAIVRMLITEFGVATRRQDWRVTLNRAEKTLARIITT